MVTLPVLFEFIYEEDLRFIKHFFMDDSIHYHVINMIQTWLNETGCMLCISFDSNHIPTSIDHRGNTIIHVTKVHSHLRWSVSKDTTTVTCTIFPTLEKIYDMMMMIPNFMLDCYENDIHDLNFYDITLCSVFR